MEQQSTASRLRGYWKHILLGVIVFGSLALMLSQPPFAQDLHYHDFADRRGFFGLPNFFDVTSNVFFLFVGIAGLRFCLGSNPGRARRAWIVLFVGVACVSIGSAYYHWDPSNETLVWDRLPMTLGFMGLFAALLGEYVSDRLGAVLLVPALLLGLTSVLYWHWFDDLRLYFWIQFMPLLAVLAFMILFRPTYSHQWLLLVALALYALAKVSEAYDRPVFGLTRGLASGHTIKHLLAALSCLTILWMLRRRKPLQA
jgi:hypothetical protein